MVLKKRRQNSKREKGREKNLKLAHGKQRRKSDCGKLGLYFRIGTAKSAGNRSTLA